MRRSNKYYKILGISTISILALIVILLIAVRVILSDRALTSLVNKYTNEYLDARVKVDSVELSIFKEFPYAGIKLINGQVLSNITDKDSLLSFKELIISISVPKIIVSKFDIKRVRVVNPKVYAYVNYAGEENWNIIRQTNKDSLNQDSEDFALDLNLNRINILGGAKIVYDNRKDSLFATISLNKLRLRGNIALDQNSLRLDKGSLSKFSITIDKLLAEKDNFSNFNNTPDSLSFKTEMYGVGPRKSSASLMVDSLNISSKARGDFNISAITHSNLKVGDLVLINDLPLEINGGVKFDTIAKNNMCVKELQVGAAGIPFVFNGNIIIDKDGLQTEDLCAKVMEFQLSNFIKYIPIKVFPFAEKIHTNAILNIDADFNGRYDFNTGEIPSVAFSLQVPQSSIKINNANLALNELAADIRGFYNSKKIDSSGIIINKLVAKGMGIDFSSKGSVSNFMIDPYLNLSVKGGFNLDTLSYLFPPKRSDVVLRGAMSGDFEVKSSVSNLSIFNLAQSNLKGDFDSDSLRINFPSLDFYCYLHNVCLKMGSNANTKDTSIAQGTRMVGMSITIDSLNLKNTDSLIVRGSDISLKGHNAASILNNKEKRDSSKIVVHPFNGQITAKRLELAGLDSARLLFLGSVNRLSILPYNGDESIPHIKLSSKNKELSIRSNINNYSIIEGIVTIDAVRQRVQRVRRNTNTRAIVLNDEDNIDLKVDNKYLTGILRNWSLKGNVNAQKGDVITPYFPLHNSLEDINIAFNLDSIIIQNTLFNLGQSNIKVTGNISGIRGSLLRGGRAKIRTNLNLSADTLNFNELILAGIRGSEYAESTDSFKESVTEVNFITPDSLNNSVLIIIPGNVDANVNLDVDYGKYGSLILNQATGNLIVKNRCLLIEDFDAQTSAGEMLLNAFYSTKTRKDISVGFDLELKDLYVDQFLTLVPSIDTLLPMLSSFKGILNCQMAATAQLDTNMNFLMNSINGVAKIKGDSLVLMDGETFSEISKMLYFKNKKKNLVEKIAVEIMVKDSNIEVFPFVMEIDRYRTAISGEQDMDLNFKYHISVLKSPIPIRLGVNVFGNLDDFHFKIGKAKYKGTNLPVYTHVIDQTRLNLRDYIYNIFDKGVDAAMKEGIDNSALNDLRLKYGDTLSTHIEALTAKDSVRLE